MDAQVLARWQFGITTVYHFFFVPVTIGMSWLVAVMETRWLRSKNDMWLRLTKFFSKLFLINFAAGVVTGIVQEFQFGMNWSEYSRFMGDIFGVPLAFEALIAFFLESTFIGLWIFGWDKLAPKLHNACMYIVAFSTTISAAFILAANAFMQNPVGATYNNGRAELVDFGAVLTNPFFLTMYPHVIAASLLTAGAIVAGISAWKMAQVAKESRTLTIDGEIVEETSVWRPTARMGAWVMIVSAVALILSGHFQAQVVANLQPMKLAATEGHVETQSPAPFAIVGIYTQDRNEEGITEVTKVWSWEVPYVLSFMAFNDPNAEVRGITDLTEEYLEKGYFHIDGQQSQLQQEYAAELAEMDVDPVPNVMVSFYSFRLMMGVGMLAVVGAIAILALTRGDKAPPANGVWKFSMGIMPFLPLIANTFGWIATEMGRQPWIVTGVYPTLVAHSPNVSAGEVLFSMIAYTAIYAIVAVVVLYLFFRYIKIGLPEDVVPADDADDSTVYFAY